MLRVVGMLLYVCCVVCVAWSLRFAVCGVALRHVCSFGVCYVLCALFVVCWLLIDVDRCVMFVVC